MAIKCHNTEHFRQWYSDTVSLAVMGRIVLEEYANNPMAAYSTIQFDMGTSAEIFELASEESFSVK